MNIDWGWVRKQLLKKEKVPASAIDCLRECLEEAGSSASPAVASVRKKIGDIGLTGSIVSSYMKAATDAHIFLATLGGRIEEAASRRMAEGEHLRGYLLDRIGSFAVESLAESVEAKLRRDYAAKGLSVSMRFSPGYCDWPIEEQAKLSSLLDFQKAGVRLTESFMMVPRKSISAMVGIGPKGVFSKTRSPCGTCEKWDCDHRRSG